MTLLITTRKTEERGNGTLRDFYFSFPVLNADELFVYILTDGDDEAVLREDYDAYGIGNEDGGYIHFNSSFVPAANQVVHIQRWVENTQETNYVENDPFPADAHENTLDRMVMMIQQTLQFYGVAQPGAFLMWDEHGEYIVNGPDAMDIANAEDHAHEAYQFYLDALAAALAARNWAGGALNTDFTYAGLVSKSAYHYATLAMVYTIFPYGTVCWFGQDTAPIGWTTQTQFDDCLIGVRSTTPGGSYYINTNPWTLRVPGTTPKAFQVAATNGLGDIMICGSYGAGTPPGRLYKSTDYGSNWAEIQPAGNTNKYWFDVDMSATGANMIACAYNGRLYTSTNYGANWTERQPSGNADKYWTNVACDSTGTHMYACVGAYYDSSGRVWHSSDSGVSWSEIKPKGDYSGQWSVIDCSDDGSKVIVCEYWSTGYGTNGQYGRLWTSDDYGATWTERRPAGNVAKAWYGVAMDSDGSHMAAHISGGYVYVSTDGGVNWSEKAISASNWRGLAMNADGSIMYASIYGGYVYRSIDSGATWARDTNLPTAYYNGNNVAMNDVGDRMLIGYGTTSVPGSIYTYAPVAAATAIKGTWDLGSHVHPQTVHSHAVGSIAISIPAHVHKWMASDGRSTFDASGNAIDTASYLSGNTSTGMILQVTKANSRVNTADFYTDSSSGAGGSATGSTADSSAVNTGGTAMGSAWRPAACIGIVAKLTTIPTV